jgi:hypothetical protein
MARLTIKAAGASTIGRGMSSSFAASRSAFARRFAARVTSFSTDRRVRARTDGSQWRCMKSGPHVTGH